MTDADQREDLPDDERDEVLGARLGLVLITTLGFLLGALTCGGWWALFPPARGERWPLPTVAIVSGVLLLLGYLQLTRRVGRNVADWFALGYALAMVAFAGFVMGDQALEFVRERLRDAGNV